VHGIIYASNIAKFIGLDRKFTQEKFKNKYTAKTGLQYIREINEIH
jgi:hypothetical protein